MEEIHLAPHLNKEYICIYVHNKPFFLSLGTPVSNLLFIYLGLYKIYVLVANHPPSSSPPDDTILL